MSRRLQFSLAIAGAVCFAAIIFLLPTELDAFLSVPAENRRALLAKLYVGGVAVAIGAFTAAAIGAIVFAARLYRIRTNRQFQFSFRSLLVFVTAAPFALWVASWQCDDAYQWLAMSVLAAIVFLLLKL